ncbi:MAG: PQQ-binding-like beta-propeller repeat protein [Anaerolineae bacterium]|nr:PQQ-binding-like beta-propeller repeat protein [Anaerolineae bacterium]
MTKTFFMIREMQRGSMDRRQRRKIFLAATFLLILVCCGSIYFCGATAEKWLPRIAVSVIHPEEPWPLTDEYVWENDLDHAIVAAPVIADDRVYVETYNGLAAINLQTGTLKWERKLDLRNPNSSLAAGNGFVAAGTPNGVIVLRGDSGEKAWHYTSPFAFPVSFIIAQDRLYASFAFEEVCAFDLPSGELLWRSREANKQHSLPYLVLASHLVVVQEEGRVYALDTESGQTEWESHLDDVLIEPALVDTEQVVINGDKAIYSINTSNGQVQWQTPSGGKGTGSPLVVGNRIFWVVRIEAQSTSVQAADVQAGKPIWAMNTGLEIINHPLASDGQTLWVRASYPRSLLLSYDIVTGQQMAKKSFRVPLYQPFGGIGPVIDNGKLYLVSGNRIAAYNIQP